MKRLWLHIGAPKTGSTALQHCFNDHRAVLAEAGLTYVTPDKKSSANSVAVALNKRRQDDIAKLSRDLSVKLDAVSQDALISSEMFFGRSPAWLKHALPDLSPDTTTVLVWLRRQDHYLESKYIQKLKNGRFSGSFNDYLEKFDGSGADYAAALAPWQDAGFPIRVLLSSSPIVDVALEVLGLTGRVDIQSPAPANSSPSQLRLDLLGAAARAGHPNLRRLQRQLPPDERPKARILTNADRKALMERYAAANEVIRATYFPHMATLFDQTDLDAPDPIAETRLSTDQLLEIEQLLRVFRDTQ